MINTQSIREWLNSWGDGTNWMDPKGETVPIAKTTLLDLLQEIDAQRALDDSLGAWKRSVCVQIFDALARRDKAEVECKRLRALLECK